MKAGDIPVIGTHVLAQDDLVEVYAYDYHGNRYAQRTFAIEEEVAAIEYMSQLRLAAEQIVADKQQLNATHA